MKLDVISILKSKVEYLFPWNMDNQYVPISRFPPKLRLNVLHALLEKDKKNFKSGFTSTKADWKTELRGVVGSKDGKFKLSPTFIFSDSKN